MSTKQEVIELIKNLPDDVTIDDIMEGLYKKAQIEEAIYEIDQGKGSSHEKVREHFNKWLK
ncbi:hypothetical protein EV207_1455 [Scopulibacillus darangshiensis]|uniref:Uncharacterized protein n=1 Tax=Scopulibacillus darangshiensis TaxID=442528 RepID=A0A4R2NIC2_9BACL|nr:hypothetical protein [Scopulibacillus darangshiensis]TCP21151.1 hypothetical protein EV207_1455 [Scopulibacillus darangshiensis]